MKKLFSVLVALSILLSMTSAFASGDSYWIYTYKDFVEWIHSGNTVAGLWIDPENFGPFAWPSETTTLTASGDKTLSFSPHPSLGREGWTVPANMTIHGVALDYGSVQGALETAQLTIAGKWNGDVSAHKNFTLTGSVQGNVSISGNSNFDLFGEVDGDFTLCNASATVDLTKVKNMHIYEPCKISGNLKAEGLSFGGYLEAEHTLTIQSGSNVEITGDRSGSQGEELIIVENGATLTLYDGTYANIIVKSGGILNLSVKDGRNFDLINAHLTIEDGGLVNAYKGIMVNYSDYYGDKNGKITGSGTVCFWNDAEEYLPKYYYVYGDSQGETEYMTNDGNVPRVDPTVKFTSAVCEHERGDNPWIPYEEYHTYLCKKCNREIDGGLHSFDGANVIVTTGGSIFTCKQCGYIKHSGVFWEIKGGVLSIQGVGEIPYLGSTKKTPWYGKRERIKRIVIGNGVTGIDTTFADYPNLTSVQISGGISYLSFQMFQGCSGLTYVELPAEMENISTGAFDGCTALTDVYFGGTQEQWEAVRIGNKNDALNHATIHFNNPMLSITTEKTDTQTTVTVTPSNLEADTAVILLGCYRDGVLTEIQTLPYQGEALTFSVTKAYDTLKMMAWEDITDIRAVCTSIIY